MLDLVRRNASPTIGVAVAAVVFLIAKWVGVDMQAFGWGLFWGLVIVRIQNVVENVVE